MRISFLLIILSLSFNAWCLTPQQLIEDPIFKIRSEQLTAAGAGTELSNYKLWHIVSFKQEKWMQVPFQVVEMDETGLPFFEKGPKEVRGLPHLFDEIDELWLRSSDFGTSVNPLPEAFDEVSAHEICLGENREGVKPCVYLLPGAIPEVIDADEGLSQQQLVSFDSDNADLRTTHFQLNMDPKNYFLWDDFYFDPYTGPQEGSLLDTIKIRMAGGVFTRFAHIELDNHNLRARLLDYQSGSLSSILLLKTKVIIAKIPVLSLYIYFQVFPQQIDISAQASLPVIFRKVLKNPTMSISLDGNELTGARFTTALADNKWGEVDGRIDKIEKELIKNGINNDNSWIWFDTKNKFSLACFMDVPDNLDIPISLFYQDDRELKNKPERFKGQWPNIGYAIDAIPKEKEFFFTASLVFSSRTAEDVFGQ